MAERVFCVDFGSAYTKVALRRDPTADSELLEIGPGDLDWFAPTLVVVDRRGSTPKLEFGEPAADRVTGDGIDKYENFKKDLFTDPTSAPDKPQVPPLDTLLTSTEFAALAAKYSVSPAQVAALQAMTTAARALSAAPGERTVSVEAQRQSNAVKLAYHFFLWLRKRLLEVCTRRAVPGLKFEEFPVRVAVPALTPGQDPAEHPGCKLLREVLHRTGWPLHAERPFVAEPEANAVGILTKAANVLSRTGRIQLGPMFNRGPLITVVKGDPHHTTYRALVIDVGAFTTDFGALLITTDGKFVIPANSGWFGVTQHSVPFGISNLDASVRAALPKEKREWLEKAPRKEFERFQESAYMEGKGYRVPGLGVIGGEADHGAVPTCLQEFSKRLAKEATMFCAQFEPASIQELILSGGGSFIPAVRDALQDAAKAGGWQFVNTHGPNLKRLKGTLTDSLDELFTRGGSALGGASIYFEKCYN